MKVRFVVPALLIIHAALLAWGAWRHAPTVDEIAYLGAGVGHWTHGRFELARVSPPLVRLVAAAPVVLAGPNVDWNRYTGSQVVREEHPVGYDFLVANGERSLWLFTLARWACIPFSLIGAWFCYRWAGELYGQAAGMFAVVLWFFDPNVIAHGQLITPDAGVTALGLAAAYWFWRWLESPRWSLALVAGVWLGLAQTAKTTVVIFFVLWPLIWLIARRRDRRTSMARQLAQLTFILCIAIYALNMIYGFQGSFRRLGDYRFVSGALSGESLSAGETGNRFAGTVFGALPVPLPADYALGIDAQKRDFEDPDRRFRAYLGGEWSDTGWSYYYLYALAVKVPLGVWLLAAIAILVRLRHGTPSRRGELMLFVPAAALLVLVSSQTGINQHARYALPVLPFAFVFASQAALLLTTAKRSAASLSAAALSWSVASSLWCYPHSLSYFNELAGGPRGGPNHLLHSNVDWGQDLLYLRDWSRRHPDAKPLAIAYAESAPPSLAGLDGPAPSAGRAPGKLPEGDLEPGWYAVSVVFVHGETWPRRYDVEYFANFEPVARVGYTTNVYHLTASDIEAAREQERNAHD